MICVLNASNPNDISLESDEYVDLRDRKSCFQDGKVIKHCRSFHSWAYSLETEFFVYNKPGWQGCFKYDAVIVLVHRDIGSVLPLVKKLRLMGKKVAITYHEGTQNLLHEHPSAWIELQKVVYEAGGYLNFIGQYREFWEGMFQNAIVGGANHTNPFDNAHLIDLPKERNRNILIGTRTFSQRLSRNTLITLASLSGWQRNFPDVTIDFICEDNGDIQRLLDKMGFDNVTLHKGPLEYNDWLKFISNYRAVIHHDSSGNLSQIALDCMLVGNVCLGSTGHVNGDTFTTDGQQVSILLTMTRNHAIPVWRNDIVLERQQKMIKTSYWPDNIKNDIHRFFGMMK